MSRIDELSARIEAGEVIDLDREAKLLKLEFARQGQRYVDDIVALLFSLDEQHHFGGAERIELNESGGISAIRFQIDGEEKA